MRSRPDRVDLWLTIVIELNDTGCIRSVNSSAFHFEANVRSSNVFNAIKAVVVLAVVVGLIAMWTIWREASVPPIDPDDDGFERTDYSHPGDKNADLLVDDTLESKRTVFDPEIAHSEPYHGLKINLSEAVIKLDSPPIQAEREPELLTIYPSYAAAVEALKRNRDRVIPSANLIDGKAKQFDDGLMAALDRAYFEGSIPKLQSRVKWARKLLEKLKHNPQSPAAAFVRAGLELAEGTGAKSDEKGIDFGAERRFLDEFLRDQVRSKPISYYTWCESLERCFRFARFFQTPFARDVSIPNEIAATLRENPQLLAEYRAIIQFDSRLTNPPATRTLLDAIDKPITLAAGESVCVFPPSTSRHQELFSRLFPMFLPAEADLMPELLVAIRSGRVDLSPRVDGGFFDYQVYALETMLLPERGEESSKLLLMKTYKIRMIDMFKALLTKRIESHIRGLKTASTKGLVPPWTIEMRPRLRIEPCSSYYLRTARSYAFLDDFLTRTVGEEALSKLHGLKQGGERRDDLASELKLMSSLFYGFYLITAEDIGMKPNLIEDEFAAADRCRETAKAWLKTWRSDPDLAVDTRISAPIFRDASVVRNVTRLWLTIGVRIAPLDASFARRPRTKPEHGVGEWMDNDELVYKSAKYFIPVDEFADVELKGSRSISREELRTTCDRAKTKPAIIKALHAM